MIISCRYFYIKCTVNLCLLADIINNKHETKDEKSSYPSRPFWKVSSPILSRHRQHYFSDVIPVICHTMQFLCMCVERHRAKHDGNNWFIFPSKCDSYLMDLLQNCEKQIKIIFVHCSYTKCGHLDFYMRPFNGRMKMLLIIIYCRKTV